MAHQFDFVSGLLAAKNFQQAVHVLNKILKKQPDDLHAKVLKCGALRGLGQEAEADQLLDSVCFACEAQQADAAALQALEVHCRAARLHVRLARVYEAVLARPGHNLPRQLALRSKLFESYVLTGDSRKQQQQAIILYKLNPRNIYQCWTVISMLLEEGIDKSELAEKMFEKLKGKKSRQETYLELKILERRGKIEEALALVKNSDDFLNHPQEKLLELYMTLKLWKEALEKLESRLHSSPDSWADWLMYIEASVAVGKNEDDINKFLTDLANQNPKLRGPKLARIELQKKNLNYKAMPDLIIEYFKIFDDKSMCVSDLHAYLRLMDKPDSEKILQAISPPCDLNECQKTLGVLRHISLLKITAFLGRYDHLGENEKETLSRDLLQCYRSSSDTERHYYVIMRAHVLYNLFLNSGNYLHLIDALSLIEDALEEFPRFAPLLLISVKLYLKLGAGEAAFQMYKLLGIQNVQVDSMAHVLLLHIASTGLLCKASELWMSALVTLTEMVVDTSDLLLWCYAEEHYDRIEELTRMLKRVERTVQRPILRIERVYLDLTMGSIAIKNGAPVDWSSCVDNRDFDVLPRWPRPTNEKDIQDLSFQQLINYGKVREAALNCVATGSTFLKQRQNSHKEAYQEALKNVARLHEESLQNDVSWPDELCLPLPVKLGIWLDSPVLSLLASMQDMEKPDVFLSSVKDVMRWLKDYTGDMSLCKIREGFDAFVVALELISIAIVICGSGRVEERVLVAVEEVVSQMDALILRWLDCPLVNGGPQCLLDERVHVVHSKLKTSHQLAVDDMRKALRKKITLLHKINKT